MTRALIEFLTRRKTMGCVGNNKDTPLFARHPSGKRALGVNPCAPPSAFKIHFAKDFPPPPVGGIRKRSLILILRSPYECIASHHWHLIKNKQAADGNESSSSSKSPFALSLDIVPYLNNILFFHEYVGRKKLFYYEDIKQDPHDFIDQLGRFFRVPPSRIAQCKAQSESIQAYSLKVLHKPPISHRDTHFYRNAGKQHDTPLQRRPPQLICVPSLGSLPNNAKYFHICHLISRYYNDGGCPATPPVMSVIPSCGAPNTSLQSSSSTEGVGVVKDQEDRSSSHPEVREGSKNQPPCLLPEIYFGLQGNLANQMYQIGALLCWKWSVLSAGKTLPEIFLYHKTPHTQYAKTVLGGSFPYKKPSTEKAAAPCCFVDLKHTISVAEGLRAAGLELDGDGAAASGVMVDIRGFLQSATHTSCYRKELRSVFQLDPTDVTLRHYQELNGGRPYQKNYSLDRRQICFVHVRRGDYCTLQIQLPMTFYDRAIDLLLQKQQHVSLEFWVFSDDIEFCRSYFTKQQTKWWRFIKFVPKSLQTKPIESLRLMTLCDHGIIANSTFSCWAAYYLDRNVEKSGPGGSGIVIAPRETKALAEHFSTLLLSHWIRV